MTIEQLLPLLLLFPLIGGLINGILGKHLPKEIVGIIATLATSISFVFAVMIFNQLGQQAVQVKLFTMINLGDIHLDASLLADNLSIWMTMIVTGVGALIHLFSMGYMHEDKGYYKFFTYLNVFIFSMLLLLLGANYFMLFFGWEGVGICSFLLIGFHYNDKQKGFLNGDAARKAFIMNRIGDLGLLIGLFLILFNYGTLDYLTLGKLFLADGFLPNIGLITAITLCLFIGATGKSAQLPLFTWLPDAMAGPTPVSALIHAATMVTAGIFLVIRSNYMFEFAPITQDIMLYIGLATSLVAAFIALRQNDIKKVLAYSTVSQLGLLFVALGMGAYTAALFHVTTHAFFKALLFLGSGSVIHAVSDEQDIRKMGGLKNKIPFTHLTFLIGTLAITGFPLLSGFFSKDEILGFVFLKSIPLYIVVMFSVLLTAIYMFRMYFLTFHGTFRGTKEVEDHIHEGPMSMKLPLLVLAILSVIGGIINLPGLFLKKGTHYLTHVLEANVLGMDKIEMTHLAHSTMLVLMSIAVLSCLVILYLSYVTYVKKGALAKEDAALTGWERLSNGKLFIDEFYSVLFVRPIEWLSEKGLMFFEIVVLNGIIGGLVKGLGVSGESVKQWQTGKINNYVLWMVVGIVGLIIYYLVKI